MIIEDRMKKMSEKIGEMSEDTPEAGQLTTEEASELRQSRWTVISFDQIIAADLPYDAATKILQQKQSEKIAGLCIITNEAAARMNREKR